MGQIRPFNCSQDEISLSRSTTTRTVRALPSAPTITSHARIAREGVVAGSRQVGPTRARRAIRIEEDRAPLRRDQCRRSLAGRSFHLGPVAPDFCGGNAVRRGTRESFGEGVGHRLLEDRAGGLGIGRSGLDDELVIDRGDQPAVACHRELIAYQPQVSFELINFMELIGECMGNGE